MKFFEALANLLLFRNSTIMPRWLEIVHSVIAWGCVVLLVLAFGQILNVI